MIFNLPIIVKAESKEDYLSATLFVTPHEQCCCSLMRRILDKEDGVYLIRRTNEVVGVFFFAEKNIMLPCLPKVGRHTRRMLKAFLGDRAVFCISGASEYVRPIEAIMQSLGGQRLWERRSYSLMRYAGSRSDFPLPCGLRIERAGDGDWQNLLPLHNAYIREEVLLKGTTLKGELEKHNLQTALDKQIVIMAVDSSGNAVAKAQTNAISLNAIQLGGVYTKDEYRRRGIAGILASFIAESVRKNGIATVLFVDKRNTTAIHAYLRAGFVEVGKDYTIEYYK